MKRTVFALTSSVVLAGTLAFAQSPAPQTPNPAQDPSPRPAPSATQPAPSASSQQDKAPELRLTGCLTQGSSPTVFILDNAKMSTDSKTAEGKKYVVVMSDAGSLRNQLNRQVTITGTADEKSGASASPSAGAPGGDQPRAGAGASGERDLPRLAAKSIVRVADVCTTAE